MAAQQTWLLDFDETLASSNITWAFQHAFPKFIREHKLEYNPERLGKVILRLQQRASENYDLDALLHELFESMAWPHRLQSLLMDDLWSGYQPALYEDTLTFLDRLREKQHRVLVVSNSPRTPDQLRILGLDSYVQQVFTPHICANTQPKPHLSLWEFILTSETDIDPTTTVVVGDDPWSDGAFADACGLQCWIVDRMNRFSDLRSQKSYRWVGSLLEIRL
jgi:FMN phosphatase YigB (HAD superfamily)